MFENFRSLYLKLKVIFDFVFFPVNFIYEKIEDLGYHLRDKKGYKQVNIAFSAILPLIVFVCFFTLYLKEYQKTAFVFFGYLVFYFVYSKLNLIETDTYRKKTMRFLAWFKIFLGIFLLLSTVYDLTNIPLTIFFSIMIMSWSGFWLWLALDEEPPKKKKYERKEKNNLEILKPMALN